MTPKWTTQKEQASALVAEDTENDSVIAAKCAVSKSALERWKRQPEFQRRVEEHRAKSAKVIEQYIAKQTRHRLANKDKATDTVLEAGRAILANFADYVDGAERDISKLTINGHEAGTAKIAVDILMAAAKLEGWLVDKQEQAGPNGGPLKVIVEYVGGET